MTALEIINCTNFDVIRALQTHGRAYVCTYIRTHGHQVIL